MYPPAGYVSPAGFPVTEWTLVEEAGQGDVEHRRTSLANLLCRYVPALKVHIMRRYGLKAEQAEDLLQSFLSDRFLERNLARLADRNRGRFRSFLLTTLDNFVRNALNYEGAMKRSPTNGLSLSDPRLADSIAGGIDPRTELSKAWAREVLGQTLRRMRAECEAAGRSDVWKVFECRIRSPILEHTQPISYDCLARELGLQHPLQAASLLTTAKRTFRRIMRHVVREYAGNGADVDQEIRELIEILSHNGAELRR